MNRVRPTLRCPCDNRYLQTAFHYDAPPAGETRFNLNTQTYSRSYKQCSVCAHYYAFHNIDLAQLYHGDYTDKTYGDRNALRAAFERIINLPPEQSDNQARVKRIEDFIAQHLGHVDKNTFKGLDIGSGLCVFAYVMQQHGWPCTALDPDARACVHARELTSIEVIHADYAAMPENTPGLFDLITLNKVLEHVEDPVTLLAKCRHNLKSRGIIYIELPDGETAARDSYTREEFFIEHHHVFSAASCAMLVERAGFTLLDMQRLREPSGKYTVYAFLQAPQGDTL